MAVVERRPPPFLSDLDLSLWNRDRVLMDTPEFDTPLSEPIVTDLLTPSEKRLGTEIDGLEVLLSDRRMQKVSVNTKKRIMKGLYVSGAFKPQAFDAVMTPSPVEPLTEVNVEVNRAGNPGGSRV